MLDKPTTPNNVTQLTATQTQTRTRAQAKGFELQFELAERSGLPVFFHSRACREDFADLVRRNRDRVSGGVVHSFTGTAEEAEELVSMGAWASSRGGRFCWNNHQPSMPRVPLLYACMPCLTFISFMVYFSSPSFFFPLSSLYIDAARGTRAHA